MAIGIVQPPLTSDKGAILSIGMISNNNRYEIVMPVATDGTLTSTGVALAQLVSGVQVNVYPKILDCLSEDSEIIFAQAESMVIGHLVPNREDEPEDSQIGTRPPDPMPTNAGVLMTYYGDPATPGPSGGICVGKNFLAGVSEDDITGGRVDDGLYANLISLINLLGNGFDDAAGTPNKWYRVVSADRTPGASLRLAVNGTARRYCVTQRRRLTPH